MMKNKRIWAALLLAVLAFSLAGCGGGIKGKWELDIKAVMEAQGVSQEEYDAALAQSGETGMIMEFKNGNLCVITAVIGGESASQEVPYSQEGNQLIIGGLACEYKLNGNKLILVQDGQDMTFVRK